MHGEAGEGAAQPQLALGAGGNREAEVTGEDLGPVQVGLLELQPGQVGHLDHGIPGPSRMLAAQGALLTVEVLVGRLGSAFVNGGAGHGVLQATLL